jgi:Carboxypeptidase regulatory-like domain/PDZ domain
MGRGALFLVLTALVVGGVVGFVIGQQATPELPDRPAVEDERRSDPERRRTPAPAAPLPSDATIEQVADRYPVPEFETGDGVISGRVTNRAGEPVAGVKITAQRRRDNRPGRAGGKTLPDKIRRTIEQHHFEEQTKQEVLTGSDGTYRLTGLADGGHWLRASLDGYIVHASGQTHDIKPGATIEFTARAIARAEVEVLMPDGTTAKAAIVEMVGEGGTRGLGWRPGSPLTVQPGAWTVQAKTEDGVLVSDPVEATFVAGEKPPKLTLRLRPRPGIRGKVTFADGVATDSVRVALQPVHGNADPDPVLLERASKTTWVRAHDDMTYTFSDLAPGTYLIGVLVDRKAVVSAIVTVAGGMEECDLVVPSPDLSEVVFIRVLGPDGKDLADVSMSTAFRSRTNSRSGGGQSIRMPDGRWRVRRPENDDDEPETGGKHFVSARSRSHGVQEVEYVPGKDHEITIRFEDPAKLTVTIAGYVGSGYENLVTVSLAWPRKDRGHRGAGSNGAIDAEGKVTVGPVVAGPCEIHLSVSMGENRSATIAKLPITLVAGANEKTIALPRLYTLTILAEGKHAKQRLGLRAKDGDLRLWGQRPKNGKLVFRGIPAGTYFIESQGRMGGAIMTVTVSGQTTVRFDPKEANAFRVRITDPNGHFARAGLQTGDLLIGVNGEEFKNLREAQMKLFTSTDETTKLLVLRGSRRLEIAIDLKPMMQGEMEPGAQIDPTVR